MLKIEKMDIDMYNSNIILVENGDLISVKEEGNVNVQEYNSIFKYKCQDCISTFKTASSLTKHYTNIHLIRVHVCRQCPSVFKLLSKLFLHARRMHIDIKKTPKDPNNFVFHCEREDCNYMTNNGTTLKHHMFAHTGEKPHECDLCGKRFSQKTNMVTHRTRHVAEKIFSCDVCKSNYKSHDIYLSHLRTREHELREHLEENSRSSLRIVCTGCNEFFHKICDIERHLKTCTLNSDKAFKCLTCEKVYDDFCILNEHIKDHMDEIPIICPICELSGFISFTTLNHHITRFHEIKVSLRHVCRYCEVKFTEEEEMNQHIIKNHSNAVNSRKSHGSIGRFECIFEGCKFTSNTEMLINNHIIKHRTGKLDKVIKQRSINTNVKHKRGRPFKLKSYYNPKKAFIQWSFDDKHKISFISDETSQYNLLTLDLNIEDYCKTYPTTMQDLQKASSDSSK